MLKYSITEAQIYAPKIKVQSLNGIGFGTDNPSHFFTIGSSNINRMGFTPSTLDGKYYTIKPLN